jgi:aspartate-semialdehyde dehydrogenase
MNTSLSVVVVGATGNVGEAIVTLLEERDFPLVHLYLVASADSVGQSIAFRGRNLRITAADDFDFGKAQLAFMAADTVSAGTLAEKAFEAGCSVIDLTGSLDSLRSPRVMPDVSSELIGQQQRPCLLSVPSAPAAVLISTLAPICHQSAIEQATVTACLAASSRGRAGVRELARQTTELLNARPLEPKVFGKQLAFNVLAQTGEPQSDGYTAIEHRVMGECKEVLGDSLGTLAVSCIQVPVFFGDSLSVTVKTRDILAIKDLNLAYSKHEGLELFDAKEYPTVVDDAIGRDEILIGRVRHNPEDPHLIEMWIVSDNVRKAAALNAVQTAELLIKHYL